MKIHTHKAIHLTQIVLLLIVSAGCSLHIDKNKFSELRKAAKAVDTAVADTTLSYEQFGKLLQRLTEQVVQTRETVSTAEEKRLLTAYEELLTTYQDSATLWDYKVASYQYDWIPRGNIYVDNRIRVIVVNYHLPTASHVVELTGHHWESISADSLRVLWDRAHEQLKQAKLPLF